jgi:hypothetical protein
LIEEGINPPQVPEEHMIALANEAEGIFNSVQDIFDLLHEVFDDDRTPATAES